MNEEGNDVLVSINAIKKEIEKIKIQNDIIEGNIKKIKPILNRIENRGTIIDIQICNRDKLLMELTKEIALLRNIIEKDLYDKINILFDIREIQDNRIYNLNYKLNLIKKDLKYYKKDLNSSN